MSMMRRKHEDAAVPHAIDTTVLNILEAVAGARQVRANLDVALFDQHLLDSFDMMCVIFELSRAFQVEISQGEVDREAWATPRQIIGYLEIRLRQE